MDERQSAYLKLITDNLPVIVAHCDRDVRYIFVNKPYSARFGIEPEALVGRQLESVIGREAYAALRPYIEPFSAKIFHFGPVGAGTAYKLIYNLLGVIQVASTAEAMLQCEAAGIDLHAAAEQVIQIGFEFAQVRSRRRRSRRGRDFQATFFRQALDLAHGQLFFDDATRELQ